MGEGEDHVGEGRGKGVDEHEEGEEVLHKKKENNESLQHHKFRFYHFVPSAHATLEEGDQAMLLIFLVGGHHQNTSLFPGQSTLVPWGV